MTGPEGSVNDPEVQMGEFCPEAELENTEQLLSVSSEKGSSLGDQNFPLCRIADHTDDTEGREPL